MRRRQTKEELVQEFAKWTNLNDKNGNIWFRPINQEGWELLNYCSWKIDSFIYIANDIYAEYKKAFFDGKKVQKKSTGSDEWETVESILEIEGDHEFRIVSLEWYEDPKNECKLVLVRDEDNEEWIVDIFKCYQDDAQYSFVCKNSSYKQARLATISDLVVLDYLDREKDEKVKND